MLEALALSSTWGGRGWHDAPRLCIPPREEHHLSLPDGLHPSHLGMTVFCKFLFVSHICRNVAVPCQRAQWQWLRFPLAKQRPFFHTSIWVSSQLLYNRGCAPLKAVLELLLMPCIGRRYILTHPSSCFQGDDSEPSPPARARHGSSPSATVPGSAQGQRLLPTGSTGNPAGKNSRGLGFTSGQHFTRGGSP